MNYIRFIFKIKAIKINKYLLKRDLLLINFIKTNSKFYELHPFYF